MKREQVETIIWIFGIIVLLLLSVKILTSESKYDCNQCTVELKNQMAGQDDFFLFGEFKIVDLITQLRDENTCKIKWTPTEGYKEVNDAPQ